jgi:hypothetical protein
MRDIQNNLFTCVIDKNKHINEKLDVWRGTNNDWAKYGIIEPPYNDLNNERVMEFDD